MTTYYNAEFAAEFIVKRDKDGNWCKWTGSAYTSLITGLNGTVYCMAEGPDGKIYAGGRFTDAGGVTNADYLARWNPVTELWEAVGASAFTDPGGGITVKALTFDAGGNLLIVGAFLNAGGVSAADYFAKFDGTNWTALGSGIDAQVNAVAVDENGIIYIGGAFTTAGGNTNCNRIAYYDTLTSNWKPLSTGLNSIVLTLGISYGGVLYIGGAFTDTSYPYLCYWDGSAFQMVGEVAMTGEVYTIKFDDMGKLIAGGSFTNAGNIPDADYIARWNGTSWEALGTGTNGSIRSIEVSNNKYLVGGLFSTAGGLTLTDRVAVWSNGAWQPLDIDLPGAATVNSILPASDGSLYIGGSFSTAGETPDVNAVCGLSYEVEVAEEIEDAVDEDDIDPIDNTGV